MNVISRTIAPAVSLRSLILIIFISQCNGMVSFAQKDPKNLQSPIFYEKAYLHTDQEVYAPRQTVWYKSYLLDARTNRLTQTSKVLYVELISPDEHILVKQTVLLEQGVAKGDFDLPDSLTTGNYLLRAYTNWMLNFGDKFVFQKFIRVVNPKSSANAPESISTASEQPEIRFFPEGGSLIEGVKSRIAVELKSNHPTEHPIGFVLNSRNDTVSRFKINDEGLGSFLLEPAADETYTANIRQSSLELMKMQLPSALKTGLSIFIQDKDSVVNVLSYLNKQTFEMLQGKKIYLAVSKSGKVVLIREITVDAPQLTVRIGKAVLPAGISIVTLYDDQKRPQCERLIFVRHTTRPNILISTSINVPGKREEDKLNIKISDYQGKSLSANLSMVITDRKMNLSDEFNIERYLLTRSELISDPSYHSALDDPGYEQAGRLDLALMTYGWRNYTWRRSADSVLRIKFLPEQGIPVGGKVVDIQSAPSLNVGLRLPGGFGRSLYSTRTDSMGRFYIEPVLYGTQLVTLTSLDSKMQPLGTILLDIRDYRHEQIGLPKRPGMFRSSISDSSFLAAFALLKAGSIVLKTVEIKGKKPSTTIITDGDRLIDMGYREEDFVVAPADNKNYQDLKHYLLHHSGYTVEYTGNDTQAASDKMLFYGNGRYYVSPVIELNGKIIMPPMRDFNIITDTARLVDRPYLAADPFREQNSIDEQIGKLTMDKIERIHIRKVMRFLPGFADPINAYIVSVTTKAGALDANVSGRAMVQLEGFYQSRDFYTVRTRQLEEAGIPSSTLAWEPMISTGDNGEAIITLPVSIKGKTVDIMLQGIGQQGEVISYQQRLQIP